SRLREQRRLPPQHARPPAVGRDLLERDERGGEPNPPAPFPAREGGADLYKINGCDRPCDAVTPSLSLPGRGICPYDPRHPSPSPVRLRRRRGWSAKGGPGEGRSLPCNQPKPSQ